MADPRKIEGWVKFGNAEFRFGGDTHPALAEMTVPDLEAFEAQLNADLKSVHAEIERRRTS